MLDQQQILRLILDRDFYVRVKDKLVPTMFPDEIRTVYETITKAQEKYTRSLTLDEVKSLHRTDHPTLTRAQRNNILELFTDIEQLSPFGPDVGLDILENLWKLETFREIGDISVRGLEGGEPDLERIRQIIEERGDSFVPQDDFTEVPNDLDELLAEIDAEPSWLFNIPSLNRKLPGMSGGELMITFARPEVGKSAFNVSLACAPGGWCWQGAEVLFVCNEEPGKRTQLRAVTAACQKPKEWVRENMAEARVIWNQIKPKFKIIDSPDMSLSKLDAICRRRKPDIVVVDQLDKVIVSGQYAATHERLKALYIGARAIAKRHNLLMSAVSQASAEAEGKMAITYAMMDGSKTGKAAEADVIVGIGKYPTPEDGGAEDMTRGLHISKNKISSYHGTIYTKLNPMISTYSD